MREIVVISGKGGTGKTSVSVSLAILANRTAVLADCDVDASNMHLAMKVEIEDRSIFKAGLEACLDSSLCKSCAICRTHCAFDAIQIENGNITIKSPLCEGCALCMELCPAKAITMKEKICGELYKSSSAAGYMIHARLNPGAENSGKLVRQVRLKARELAAKTGKQLIITDGPPGTGCPVISSISDASLALIVTEATVSGLHDMQRVIALCRHFKVPVAVCINKWDINKEKSAEIELFIKENDIPCFGRIPYDRKISESIFRREPFVLHSGAAAQALCDIWKELNLFFIRKEQ